MIPLDMTPYSFGGESVKEKAIVAFPLSMEMLFGLSRSEWILLLSDFDEKRFQAEQLLLSYHWRVMLFKGEADRKKKGMRDLQSINLMCYIHAKRAKHSSWRKYVFQNDVFMLKMEKGGEGKASVELMFYCFWAKICFQQILKYTFNFLCSSLTLFGFSNNHLLWWCCRQRNFYWESFQVKCEWKEKYNFLRLTINSDRTFSLTKWILWYASVVAKIPNRQALNRQFHVRSNWKFLHYSFNRTFSNQEHSTHRYEFSL